MTQIKQFALSCCLLCALGGVVRIFWPENRFKPVINAVLLLYIVASVLPVWSGADWQGLTAALRGWAKGAAAVDYSAYAAELGRKAAADAIAAQLQAHGITAAVAVNEELCTVTLAPGADAAAAEAIVQAACGTLPYRITGGERP